MIHNSMTINGFELKLSYVCPVKNTVAHRNIQLSLDTWHSYDENGHIEPDNVYAAFECMKCGYWHNFSWELHP